MRKIPDPGRSPLTPVVYDLWLELGELEQPFRRSERRVHSAFRRVQRAHFEDIRKGYSAMTTVWNHIRRWGWVKMEGREQGPKTAYRVAFGDIAEGPYALPEEYS